MRIFDVRVFNLRVETGALHEAAFKGLTAKSLRKARFMGVVQAA